MSEDKTVDLIIARLDAQDEVLQRIEAKVDKTNGRVSALEMWRHGIQVLKDKGAGRRAIIIGLISGSVVAVVGAVATAVVTVLVTA